MYTKYDTCTMPCSYLSDPTFGSHNIHADNYWQSGSSRSNMQLINNLIKWIIFIACQADLASSGGGGGGGCNCTRLHPPGYGLELCQGTKNTRSL